MPYINIRVGDSVESGQRKRLFDSTTSLMSSLMGKRPEVTVVHIQESGPAQWSVNGKPLAETSPVAVFVEIKVTLGTNTVEEQAAMISQTAMMLKEVLGATQEACYVVINEIPAVSWGFDGKTQAARAAGV